MRQIDSFFATSIDRTLFHYTGVGSLVGMASTCMVWASHIYFLNDSQEIFHACDRLEEVIQPQLAVANLTTEQLEFSKQFLLWVRSFHGNRYNLFVFSLSEEKSLLSQWRSYTPHGKGVSIGFSPELLLRLADENQLKLARCVYTVEEQRELLTSLFQKMLTTFSDRKPAPNLRGSPPECSYFSFLEDFRNEVFQVLAIIKHEAFKEEKEWRLISRYFANYTVPEIDFREGASMLVPYIRLPLGPKRPIFETVVLGPSPHEELSFSALHMFLANKRLCGSTENSRIPYREW